MGALAPPVGLPQIVDVRIAHMTAWATAVPASFGPVWGQINRRCSRARGNGGCPVAPRGAAPLVCARMTHAPRRGNQLFNRWNLVVKSSSCQRRARRVREWEKKALAAPVANDQLILTVILGED